MSQRSLRVEAAEGCGPEPGLRRGVGQIPRPHTKGTDMTGCQGWHKVGCTSRGEGADPPALAGL